MRDTYPFASLETAACMWEAVLEIEAGTTSMAPLIAAAREAIGSSGLRRTVLCWVDALDASWVRVDGFEHGRRLGRYSGAFDWEFVPDWLTLNVDWSNPHLPCLRSIVTDPQS